LPCKTHAFVVCIGADSAFAGSRRAAAPQLAAGKKPCKIALCTTFGFATRASELRWCRARQRDLRRVSSPAHRRRPFCCGHLAASRGSHSPVTLPPC
jgi:hypothetical protein